MKNMAIKCGFLINGDGESILRDRVVWVEKGFITDITGYDSIPVSLSGSWDLLDASQDMVIPGAINHHTHGCIHGPIFPSGARGLDRESVQNNIWRHIKQGTTTICNVCGFPLTDELLETRLECPANLFLTSAHTKKNLQAAETVDGLGLLEKHKTIRVEEMLERGAVAIGEIGGGHTLGGGGQDYLYIPQAIEKHTGIRIRQEEAKSLKFLCLGRSLDVRNRDEEKIQSLLNQFGISLKPEEVCGIIAESVMPSVNLALDGFFEAFEVASKYQMPLLLHTSAPSIKAIEAIAQLNSIKEQPVTLIASHCDHDTFEVEEIVETVQKLKDMNVVIDLATFDITPYSRSKTGGIAEYFDVLAKSGLADLISTDYNSGFWDGIYTGISRIVKKKYMSLPKAVALGTGNIRNYLPLLGAKRGMIQKGFHADICITSSSDVSEVKKVIIGGVIRHDVSIDQGGDIN